MSKLIIKISKTIPFFKFWSTIVHIKSEKMHILYKFNIELNYQKNLLKIIFDCTRNEMLRDLSR